VFARNTLVLPLGPDDYKDVETELTNYVRRQITRGVDVMAIGSNHDELSGLFQSFGLNRLETIPVSFATVQRVKENVRPIETKNVLLPVSIYRVAMQRRYKQVIRYDDDQAGFLNFHEKENGFRWTKDSSTITNFSFLVTSGMLRITLTTGPGKVRDLRLVLNDRIAAVVSST